MNKITHGIESTLFRSRYLLAPLYLGLVGALVLLAYRFVIEFYHLAIHIGEVNAQEFTLDLLALLDLTLLANLILMVIFAGYENFVSRIDVATDSEDRPYWMGTIDFSGLKIKLIGSLVAISVIELLWAGRSWRRHNLESDNSLNICCLWSFIRAHGLDR
jgi:uncharacterized protein (TIGR00645 family)